MRKILIVDDDEKIALALTIRLRAHGYTTWVAGDGAMALEAAIRYGPDLILLDLGLPCGDGFFLVERFQQLPETHETPIILITASHDPEMRKKALALGTSGLLRKPFDAEELADTIQKLFGWPEGVGSDAPSAAASGSAGTNSRTAKSVLIIEDDEKIAMGLAVRMKAAGLEPTVANDALAGVRSAVMKRPDLVLLDVLLPAGDGFSVAERILANLQTPTPIIFLTASKLPELKSRAVRLGAAGFFEKPYDPELLLAAVQRTLAQSDRPSACYRVDA